MGCEPGGDFYFTSLTKTVSLSGLRVTETFVPTCQSSSLHRYDGIMTPKELPTLITFVMNIMLLQCNNF